MAGRWRPGRARGARRRRPAGPGPGRARRSPPAGAGVLLVARGAEELKRRRPAIERRRRAPWPTSPTRRRSTASLAAARALGDLRVLVYAAGTNQPGPARRLRHRPTGTRCSTSTCARRSCSAARSATTCCAAASPGAIVNLSSQMGSVGYPGRAAYCATKHAVEGLTKALARRVGGGRHPRQRGRADVRAHPDDRADVRGPRVPGRGARRGACRPTSWPRSSRSPTPCATWPATRRARSPERR